jgi:hypothetical protein
VISDEDAPRDVASLVVPLAGSVQDSEDVFVPYRLVDAESLTVGPASAFLAELQASGRAEATLKSYAKALLRSGSGSAGRSWSRGIRRPEPRHGTFAAGFSWPISLTARIGGIPAIRRCHGQAQAL